MAETSPVRHDEPRSATRLFDWFDRPWASLLDWPALGMLHDGEKLLRIEEYRDGDTLVIRSEMPGIDPDKDVDIQMRDHTLEIRAERREHETKQDKGTHRSEFRYGSFYRAVTLPEGAKDNDVQASYKDGILEVRVPCKTTAQEAPQRIPVARK